MERITHEHILKNKMTWHDIVKHYDKKSTIDESESLWWFCWNRASLENGTMEPKNYLLLNNLYEHFESLNANKHD